MNTPAAPTGLPTPAFASVFQAIAGLRNGRALVALLGPLIAGIVVAFLASRLGAVGFLLGALVMAVAVGTGVNGAGVLLMDQARGVPPRSLTDALVYGLMCIPKLILLALGLLAVAIAVFIAIAIVYLICKIPYLGPLLFVVAFPVSVVVAGITLLGLFVCTVLALPAIWEGLPVMRAIAQALTIARTRLVEALLLLAMLWFLCLFVAFIVFGILGAGLLPTLGMSAGILGGGSGGMGSLLGMMQGYGGYGGLGVDGGGTGHAIAGMVGGSLLWALAASLIGQVWLLGLNLVYLRITEGLDAGATEAALLRGLDDAKRRTAELGERAKAKAAAAAAAAHERDREQTSTPAPFEPPPPFPPSEPFAPPAPPAPYAPPPGSPYAAQPRAITCPGCAAACTSDDVFCGVCGQRLK